MMPTNNNTATQIKRLTTHMIIIYAGLLASFFLLLQSSYLTIQNVSSRIIRRENGNTRHTENYTEAKTHISVYNINASSGVQGFVKSTIDKPLVDLDLVVILSGELGNNLLKIAYGKIIQLLALTDGRFNFTMRYVSQGHEGARKELVTCFSRHFSTDKVNLKEWKYNSQEWIEIVRNQTKIVQGFFTDWDAPVEAAAKLTMGKQERTVEDIISRLDHLETVRHRMMLQQQKQSASHHNNSIIKHTFDDAYSYNVQKLVTKNQLSLPFVIADNFPSRSLMDRYHDQLNELFTFNKEKCCRSFPDPDETVLHIRGFEVELSAKWSPRKFKNSNFRELDPKRTAYELLGHLNTGDKVAIVSRFEEKKLKNYTGVLRERGFQTRFVTGSTGVQDFCFLMNAEKEVVGNQASTFLRMAAMLSDTVNNVTLYCMRHPKKWCAKVTNLSSARKTFNILPFD